MTIAGIPVPREQVAWIATELDGDLAGDRLRRTLEMNVVMLGLEIDEREAILRALEDCPDGPTELRATLRQEHVGRKRDRLV